MPAQKRSSPDSLHDHHRRAKQSKDQQERPQQNRDHDYNSDGSDHNHPPFSAYEEKPEFVFVDRRNIRKDVECPICLGIIKKTRTVMECLHRFCRECIDKSMRLGNNECPTCRTHCASRRSLRDDPNFDSLIAALYPDIEKYEEEELEFREEDKNQNKLVQASIAKVVQRQSKVLVKRRRDSPGAFVKKSQHNQQILSGRQDQVIDNKGSEDNEDKNDSNEKDSSSADYQCTELGQRRQKKRTSAQLSKLSSSASADGGGCKESDMDINRENQGSSSRKVSSPQNLSWGRSGFRSHTRHGSGNGSSIKSSLNGRLSKLVDLRSLNENTDEVLVTTECFFNNEAIPVSVQFD